VEHHVVGQQLLERFEIALLGGRPKKRVASCSCCSREASNRGRRSSTCRWARETSWRAFCSLVAMISAIRS
jgi:hypothetical protein